MISEVWQALKLIWSSPGVTEGFLLLSGANWCMAYVSACAGHNERSKKFQRMGVVNSLCFIIGILFKG